MREVYEGNAAFVSDPNLASWQKGMQAGGGAVAAIQTEVTKSQAIGTLPDRRFRELGVRGGTP
jgi:hypothetical protein